MERNWIWPEPIPVDLAHELGEYSPIERQILLSRNLKTMPSVDQFLKLSNYQNYDPFKLHGMQTAVDRIVEASANGEKLAVYGDYDADGVTGTSLLMRLFNALDIECQYYIPHRIHEGYGLNTNALMKLKAQGVSLVVSVDCGIRAIDPVREAGNVGLDVIITDHHVPGEHVPDAVAVLDPKQSKDAYPFKGLAGVGLAYKLAQALKEVMQITTDIPLLELVAIGTIADLAPLVEENRILVAHGLEQLNQTQSVGLLALIEVARLNLGSISAGNIAFGLAPRINAAGRLDQANRAVDLLLTQEFDQASELANFLEQINRKRQAMTREVVELARGQLLEEAAAGDIIFSSNEDFHEGVIGLAASRLVDEFFRPSIVASRGPEITKASARSIPGFNITAALEANKDLLIQFGGHAAAAGFSVETNKISELRARLNQYASKELEEMELKPVLKIDAETDFSQLDMQLMKFVEKLEPCGEENRTPLFGARNVRVMSSRTVGRDGSHLKLVLQNDGRIFDAIAFRMGNLGGKLSSNVDVAFYFERNIYMGTENLQLNVRGLRDHEEG
jgi:single-stranded-DNA-specific exonuclease